MAGTPSFLARTPIDVPNRSGFDMSFENFFTGQCGTLNVALCKEVFPNEVIDLSVAFEAELPPMVSNFFGRVDFVYEAFYVPNSLLWGGWEDFMTHPTNNPIYPEGSVVASKPHNIPHLVFPNRNVSYAYQAGFGTKLRNYFGPYSLLNQLGFKTLAGPLSSTLNGSVDMLPFLAYHRIYHDHYRNTIVQAPVFYKPGLASNSSGINNEGRALASAPFVSFVKDRTDGDNVQDFSAGLIDNDGQEYEENRDNISGEVLGDGVSIFSLRQRNFGLDYFTAATPQPQAGGAVNITFDVTGTVGDDNSVDGEGSLSIAALRSGNAIQKWMERNNIVGYDYGDQTFAQYGCYPKFHHMHKSVYLGRYVEPVYNRSIFSTGSNSAGSNPFIENGLEVGVRFGASQANGKGRLVENFHVSDHGYLMVLCSLRPRAAYSTGVDRMLTRRRIGDIPFPLLSGTGDMAIYQSELVGNDGAAVESVFGYIDQFADVKCSLDQVHGEVQAGGVLSPYVLQRTFASGTEQEISSDFLEIPRNFLDSVKQIDSAAVPVDFWCSSYFAFGKISPFPVHSVPTLADLKDTHTKYVRRGGSRL